MICDMFCNFWKGFVNKYETDIYICQKIWLKALLNHQIYLFWHFISLAEILNHLGKLTNIFSYTKLYQKETQ